jgi:hypothetical protein
MVEMAEGTSESREDWGDWGSLRSFSKGKGVLHKVSLGRKEGFVNICVGSSKNYREIAKWILRPGEHRIRTGVGVVCI